MCGRTISTSYFETIAQTDVGCIERITRIARIFQSRITSNTDSEYFFRLTGWATDNPEASKSVTHRVLTVRLTEYLISSLGGATDMSRRLGARK